MNKSALKRFATSMRLEIISLVKTKIDFLLSDAYKENLSVYNTNKVSIKQIEDRYTKDSEDFIEEVAYTWFNRLVALRFMDVNEITSSSVISTSDEQPIPQMFIEAKSGTIEDTLNLNRELFFDLIDKKVSGVKDSDNEAYKMLFISTCNEYGKLMPYMFEEISDYTELLLPEDMLSPNSIRAKVVEAMSSEDCKNVEIIGWLYQFYINEKKDEVIQAKKKYKTSEIPFASQLFTPDWLVQYITDNTLGQLWMETNPNSTLKESMQYYVARDTLSDKKLLPEEIKVFDPCCGSGHILTYAFDLLTKIYEEEGYNKSEIPTLILENNLYGCDIDKRAMVLANFALTMKARLYHKRFFKKIVKPNIIELEEYGDERFTGIKNFGSLVRVEDSETFDDGIFAQTSKEYNLQMQMLTDKFDCIITNPPYINGSYMNTELKAFVATKYPKTKSDLFASFMERIPEMTKEDGYMGFVTPFVWMFIKSYEWLREYILENTTITNLVQLEYNAFGPAVVPVCSFTLRNSKANEKGKYIRLSDFRGVENQPIKTLEAIKDKVDYMYCAKQSNFSKILGSPIAYWANEKILTAFDKELLGDNNSPRVGMQTGNNEKLLRFWYEAHNNKIGNNLFWEKYNKGGAFRRWYGNSEHIILWKDKGKSIIAENGTLLNKSLFHLNSILWSRISNSTISFRFISSDVLCHDSAAVGIYNDSLNLLALLNTTIIDYVLQFISPTMNYQSGDLSKLPIIFSNSKDIRNKIETLTQQNIDISKEEWDSRETSWDFTKNELIKHKLDTKIETAYSNYCNHWNEQHNTLHQNEEELNRLFIDIYELQDELTPDVELKDITILKNETKKKDGELVFQADEIMKQFISYAVGVMFGRYSLDSDGLLIANMGQEVPSSTTFEIDDDNVIPVLEDDYFKDDIASRFVQFVKATFGEVDLSENIRFIESSLGTTLRKYFVKGFYEDHIKRYKKRPIYWMVASPKKGFMSLIYMHRYEVDTFARVRNSYLTEYIAKLEAHKETLTLTTTSDTASDRDKKDADKQMKNIDTKLKEIIEFDRDKMMSWSQNPTEIDLDDGVKVNYCRFKDILYPIVGLCK